MFKGILCTQKIHIAVYFILRGTIRGREVHRNMMRNKRRLINGSKKERKMGIQKKNIYSFIMTRWQFLFRKGEGGLRNKIGE